MRFLGLPALVIRSSKAYPTIILKRSCFTQSQAVYYARFRAAVASVDSSPFGQ